MLFVVVGVNVAVFTTERLVATPFRVTSASMAPALQPGDRVLVHRMRGSADDRAGAVERGDVIVLRAAGDDSLVVKRVIGLPRESIEAVDGVIAIDNDRILDETWLSASQREAGSSAMRSVDIEPTFLGGDEVFVLGDNRASSIDSRRYGPVDGSRIVGRAMAVAWPLDRARLGAPQ